MPLIVSFCLFQLRITCRPLRGQRTVFELGHSESVLILKEWRRDAPKRATFRALTGVRRAGWCLAPLGQACREEKGTNKKTGGKHEQIDGVHGARDPDVQVEGRCFVSGMSDRKRGRKGEDTEKEVFEIHRRKRVRRSRVRSKRDGVWKARILC